MTTWLELYFFSPKAYTYPSLLYNVKYSSHLTTMNHDKWTCALANIYQIAKITAEQLNNTNIHHQIILSKQTSKQKPDSADKWRLSLGDIQQDRSYVCYLNLKTFWNSTKLFSSNSFQLPRHPISVEEIKLQHRTIWAEDKRGSVSRKMCFLKSAAVIFLLSFVVYFALDAHSQHWKYFQTTAKNKSTQTKKRHFS